VKVYRLVTNFGVYNNNNLKQIVGEIFKLEVQP